MKYNHISETIFDVDGRRKTRVTRKREWENGDWIQISSSPGGRAFDTIVDYNHWSKKADGHYPVLVKVHGYFGDFLVVHLYIDKPQLNSTEMSIHHFAARYFIHCTSIIDHYTT
jgi:hypothetical protein